MLIGQAIPMRCTHCKTSSLPYICGLRAFSAQRCAIVEQVRLDDPALAGKLVGFHLHGLTRPWDGPQELVHIDMAFRLGDPGRSKSGRPYVLIIEIAHTASREQGAAWNQLERLYGADGEQGSRPLLLRMGSRPNFGHRGDHGLFTPWMPIQVLWVDRS